MNTGYAADLLKCTYMHGRARKSTFQRFLLALYWHFRTPSPPLFSRAPTAHLGRTNSQIRLRAIAQIGKISRELEKAEQSKGGRQDSGDLPTKTQQLDDAGLTLRTANRYEESRHRSRRSLASKPSCGSGCQVIELVA